MNTKCPLFALASALALSGCAQTYSPSLGQIDPADFGEANRQTYAAMIIDPDPVYEEPLAASGESAAAAIDRYYRGMVKQPETVSTTAAAGGN